MEFDARKKRGGGSFGQPLSWTEPSYAEPSAPALPPIPTRTTDTVIRPALPVISSLRGGFYPTVMGGLERAGSMMVVPAAMAARRLLMDKRKGGFQDGGATKAEYERMKAEGREQLEQALLQKMDSWRRKAKRRVAAEKWNEEKWNEIKYSLKGPSSKWIMAYYKAVQNEQLPEAKRDAEMKSADEILAEYMDEKKNRLMELVNRKFGKVYEEPEGGLAAQRRIQQTKKALNAAKKAYDKALAAHEKAMGRVGQGVPTRKTKRLPTPAPAPKPAPKPVPKPIAKPVQEQAKRVRLTRKVNQEARSRLMAATGQARIPAKYSRRVGNMLAQQRNSENVNALVAKLSRKLGKAPKKTAKKVRVVSRPPPEPASALLAVVPAAAAPATGYGSYQAFGTEAAAASSPASASSPAP